MSEAKQTDEEILTEARERFKRAQDWEAPCRVLHDADIKFGNGDSDNGYRITERFLNFCF